MTGERIATAESTTNTNQENSAGGNNSSNREGEEIQQQQQQGSRRSFIFAPFRWIGRVLRTTMNAAVTIFGLGVGVGLILGDSLRNVTGVNPNLVGSGEETPTGEANESLSTTNGPSCRSSRTRSHDTNSSSVESTYIQEPSPSTAAALLPAQ
mmetsp:Transcript_21975/g.30592  ORF Transcript_21975/g.30592 Transcript_21975/m.30592 type:complete len:153 (-) Transcript_21975:1385-1843(-)